MRNLAGVKACDVEIEQELERARIEIVRNQPRNNEVPSSLRGKLGSFTFTRAWYYWMVKGDVPLDIAKELYSDPAGRKDIRVAGDCGCPPPEEWAIWKMEDCRIAISTEEEKTFREFIDNGLLSESVLSQYVFSNDPSAIGAKAFIESYHIDTEIGLRLFADTLKKHKLV